ncbi:hypothetical protein ACHAO9_009497 [Fusarium lateritium]
MRLINAQTFITTRRISFADFYGDIPRYAILSHTWDGHQEVIFQECNLKSSKSKSGYEKIRKTCELALSDGIDYVWVDTCCIDKSSSADLTEAINSMFLWYQKASVCYVYLVDKLEGSPLADCRWFTRGWTLQEVIAPRVMIFFNYKWDRIGSKNSLMGQLTTITRIDPEILRHEAPISSACIAKRFSWAAGRNTTRVEDIAYCLLGICNVHLPMLYGEGENAFRRLQEEIVRTTYDLSILAWTPPVISDNSEKEYCGFLAESVNHFASCSGMYSVTDSILGEGDISVSNKGLRLRTPVNVRDYEDQGYRYVLGLDCMSSGADGDFLSIPMRKVGPNTFIRARSLEEGKLTSFCLESTYLEEDTFCTVTLLTTTPTSTIGSPLSTSRRSNLFSQSRFTLVSIELPPDMYTPLTSEMPVKFWDKEDHVFFGPHGSYRNWGFIALETGSVFICFWQREGTDWTFDATLLDSEKKEVQNLLRDLFLAADQLCHQPSLVHFLLTKVEDEMKSSIETYVMEEKITLSFKVWRADNQDLCSGPRWRVVFSETLC